MRRPAAALALVAALALATTLATGAAAAAAAATAPTDGAKVVATVPGDFVTDATSPDGSVEYEPSEYEYEVMPEGYVPQPGEVVYEYDPKMFESADKAGSGANAAKTGALLPESGAKKTGTDADTYEYEITSDQTGDQVAANAAKAGGGSSQFTPDGAFAGRQTDGKILSGAKDGSGADEAYTYEYEVDVPSGSENLSDEEILALVKKQREEKEAKAAAASGGQETREQQLAREQRDRESRAAQQKREEEDRLRGEGKLPPAGSDAKKVDVDVKPSSTVGGRGGEGEPVAAAPVEESKTALPPVEAVKPSDLAKRSVSAAQPAPAPAQGLSGGAKFGIAVGVLAAIALIAGGTYWAAKHKGLIGGGAAGAGGAKARTARVSGSGSRWSRGGAPA